MRSRRQTESFRSPLRSRVGEGARSQSRAGMGIACLGIAMLTASGCAAGAFDSERPADQVYVINVIPAESRAAAALPVDLAVARPLARPGLDTERIAVRYADRRLDYYLASRWGAEAGAVVQDLLIESLRASGGLRSVHGSVSTFASEYVLETELRDFQAEYAPEGEIPTVRVTLMCTLGRLKDRQALATFSASANVRAEDNNQRAVIAAFESAYRDVGQKVVAETLAVLAAVPPTVPAADTGR